jgi:hypothetical protein
MCQREQHQVLRLELAEAAAQALRFAEALAAVEAAGVGGQQRGNRDASCAISACSACCGRR